MLGLYNIHVEYAKRPIRQTAECSPGRATRTIPETCKREKKHPKCQDGLKRFTKFNAKIKYILLTDRLI